MSINTSPAEATTVSATQQVPEAGQPQTMVPHKPDRLLFLFLLVSILLSAASFGLILWKIPPTENTVFLHYNVYFGVDRTGNWRDIFWLPGSGAAMVVVNAALVLWSKRMDAFIRRLVLACTMLLQIVVFVAAVLLVLLNHAYGY
ncbi:MAG: hypothetical protein HYV32_00985 [Candidatus Kerfeldbacteria bacterium]|nr:hypothetical protein [Candidatus Kerfeldbacteria bacterium]